MTSFLLHICITVLTFVRPHRITLFTVGTLFERRHLYNFEKTKHEGTLYDQVHPREWNIILHVYCVLQSCSCIYMQDFTTCMFMCMPETARQDVGVARAHLARLFVYVYACMYMYRMWVKRHQSLFPLYNRIHSTVTF